MRVEQLHLRADLGELGEVDGAVLVDPVVQEGLAVGDGGGVIVAVGTHATLVEFLDFECEACRAAFPEEQG